MKFIKRLFRKTFIVDVNLLPSNYKTNGIVIRENLRKYEDDFNIKILPVDLSITNSKTNNTTLTFVKV